MPSAQLPDGPRETASLLPPVGVCLPGVPKGLCLNENAHSSPPEGQSCVAWVLGITLGEGEGCWVQYPGPGLPYEEPQPTHPPEPQEAVEAAESRAAPAPL